MKTTRARVGASYQPKTPATEYRPKGSRERLVGANGEFNASDKGDLIRQREAN